MDIQLPDDSFTEIATHLRDYACNEARSLEGVEVFIARYPHQAPALADVVPRARRAAVTAGRLSALFNALVAHEETVRDFFAGLAEIDAHRLPSAKEQKASPSAVCPPTAEVGPALEFPKPRIRASA